MIDFSKYQILSKVNEPKDLKHLDVAALKILAHEIREFLIDVVSQTGGHFGGGLGTVELTLALHKVFDSPKDQIVWDTGHQAYPHKVITGRKELFHTIRQFHGISGFLKRSESEHDAFGAGHASTSISAALGLACARDLRNENNHVVAVIGDGAMTGGMAYEAMNNAGFLKTNIIVVFNDNNMSISDNVWGVSRYFTEMIAHPDYNKFKSQIWDLTGKLDQFGDRLRKIASRIEGGIKSVITPGMLFEALGFRYFGPINGHNIGQMINLFEKVKKLNGPILVHAFTQKGKGYKPAEDHAQRMHGASPFDKTTGLAIAKNSEKPSYTEIFGKAIEEIVDKDKRIIGITAAMPDGTGMNFLQKHHPKNFFDVGIAEEHAVTFAAGLAAKEIIPVVAIYSTFLQRAIDQIIHDIALQRLHVVFAIDRGGIVGADGPTHHGCLDLTYLRMIPDMVIMSPKDEAELRNMLYTAIYEVKGPVAIRYPRGNGLGVEMKRDFEIIPLGRGEKLSHGSECAILSIGNMTNNALKAREILEGEGIHAAVYNMRFVKPLDFALLDEAAKNYKKIITIEENSVVGGFGAGIVEYFTDKKYKNDVLRLGLPDSFVEHGTQSELHALLKIDPKGISERIMSFIEYKKKPQEKAV